MSNIVERLRQLANLYAVEPKSHDCWEAADTITTLLAENERLRAALQMLYDEMDEYQRVNNLSAYNNHVMRQARAALAEEKKG